MARSEYVKLWEQGNPSKYDPDAWLDLAQSVGMKYVVLTTKLQALGRGRRTAL